MKPRQFTRTIDHLVRNNPHFLAELGIGFLRPYGTGKQGTTLLEPGKGRAIKIRMVNGITTENKGVRRIDSALYHDDGKKDYLTINGNDTRVLSGRDLLSLHTAVGEVVGLGQVHGAKKMQQIGVLAEGLTAVPERYLLSVNGAFSIAFTYTPIEGKRLDHHFRDGTLSPHQALRIHLDIAEIREQLKARGIVHRDIKPENIIVTTEGRAHIIDFGLAEIVKNAEIHDPVRDRQHLARKNNVRRYVVLGTPEYIAPETIPTHESPQIFVTSKADMYAQGIIEYRRIMGSTPFTRTIGHLTPIEFVQHVARFSETRWEDFRDEMHGYINGDLVDGAAQMFHPNYTFRDDSLFIKTAKEILAGEQSYERKTSVRIPQSTAIVGNPNLVSLNGSTEVTAQRNLEEQTTAILPTPPISQPYQAGHS